jgi:hypothetical protein
MSPVAEVFDQAKRHQMIRGCEELIQVTHDPETVAKKGLELAAKVIELRHAEEDKKEVVSTHTKKVKKLREEVEALSNVVDSGAEMIPVPCEWHMNTPDAGIKTLIRLDTDKVVREEKMKKEDGQMVLDDLKNHQDPDGDPDDDQTEDPEGDND